MSGGRGTRTANGDGKQRAAARVDDGRRGRIHAIEPGDTLSHAYADEVAVLNSAAPGAAITDIEDGVTSLPVATSLMPDLSQSISFTTFRAKSE